MTRPDRLVLAIGTATEVGKTWVGAAVLSRLRADGVAVAARKPAQSFDPTDPAPTDAQVLAAATGEPPDTVCAPHRQYRIAYAPPMAAAALGQAEPTAAELLAELHWPDPAPSVGWVETVGGPRSPIAVDADSVDFAAALAPDLVVLVADAELGTVNAATLAASPFRDDYSLVTILNRYDPDDDLHRRNRDWLVTRQGLDVVVDVEALAKVVRPEPH